MADMELQLVEWLRSRQSAQGIPSEVALGIGDDMAALASTAQFILVSCDMLLDGVHFDSRRQKLAQIGRKTIACSLSDCAAMAVRPLAAMISVALPKTYTLSQAQELFEGMFSIAADFDTAIVGGDTTRWDQPLAVDVAITAEPYEGIDPVTRAGAKPGDTLFVTGQLGGSLLARHLTFTPRVEEARQIAEALDVRLNAMIDLSDGLSLDLWRLMQASGVGATLDRSQVEEVISADAERAAKTDGRTPFEHALADGEDYELLLAVSDKANVPGIDLHPVGEVTEKGLFLRHSDGRVEPLAPRGYVH